MGKSSYDKDKKIPITKVTIRDKEGKVLSTDKLLYVDDGAHVTVIDFANIKGGTFELVGGFNSSAGAGVVVAGGSIEIETEKKGGGSVKTQECKMNFQAAIAKAEQFKKMEDNTGCHGFLGQDQQDFLDINLVVFDRDKEVWGARFERNKEPE